MPAAFLFDTTPFAQSHAFAASATLSRVHRLLPMERPMAQNVTDADFASEVLTANQPVLVDFWAEWCPPCKAMEPALEQLSDELAGRVKIVKLNIDENPSTTVQYGVRSIPTMILFKGGEATDMKIGALPGSALANWLESHAG
jgi:thioredoxin 1